MNDTNMVGRIRDRQRGRKRRREEEERGERERDRPGDLASAAREVVKRESERKQAKLDAACLL
jgi:hypothetical protein